MIVVSNTSPIINLTIVGQLNLLKQLYGDVIIPQAVYDEIVIEGSGQPGAEEIERLDWIEVKSVSNRSTVTALEFDLDLGEAEAIALAVELKADLLLIDERKGRIRAEWLGVNRVGILGILVSAKHRGLIPVVKPVIDDLVTKAGFWISDDLYNHILQVVGEK